MAEATKELNSWGGKSLRASPNPGYQQVRGMDQQRNRLDQYQKQKLYRFYTL